jgi:hypothetical protein
MWGGYLVFFIIIGSGYLKIKSSKNHLGSVLLVWRELKNHPSPGLRNQKKDDYEVGKG